jgi:hypothetical protein
MSRLDEFCGQCDDHEEHEWTDKHERDFRCPGRLNGHVLWSDPVIAAAVDIWIARSAAGVVSSAQEHVQAMIEVAEPIITERMRAAHERQLYDAHKRGWDEGSKVMFARIDAALLDRNEYQRWWVLHREFPWIGRFHMQGIATYLRSLFAQEE